MVTPSNQSPDRLELSPEAQALQDVINNAFAGLAQAFAKLAEPRYTMDEIEAAMEVCGCWGHFHEVREELTRARAAKL